tara:strand:+ start:1119 stop:1697 length:579 start_codon:yes stop_codon:yes gene_type:complete
LFEVKESIQEVESVWHDFCSNINTDGDDDYNNNITNNSRAVPRQPNRELRIQILFDGEMIDVDVDPTCEPRLVTTIAYNSNLQGVITHWFSLHEERYGDIPPIISCTDMGVICALQGKANGYENGKRLLTWLFTSDHSRAVWYRENKNTSPTTVLRSKVYAECLTFESESVLKQKPKNQPRVHRFDADGNLL